MSRHPHLLSEADLACLSAGFVALAALGDATADPDRRWDALIDRAHHGLAMVLVADAAARAHIAAYLDEHLEEIRDAAGESGLAAGLVTAGLLDPVRQWYGTAGAAYARTLVAQWGPGTPAG